MVLFEAQRVTKSIVYFGKTMYPIRLGVVGWVANPQASREMVGSEHDNTRNAFSHDWCLLLGQGSIKQSAVSHRDKTKNNKRDGRSLDAELQQSSSRQPIQTFIRSKQLH